MAGFCKHCGRELEGNEPYCPECGSPTGIYQSQPAYAPRRGGNSVAIAIVVLIVAFSILAIALVPMFLDTGTTEKYTVTVKIESVSVNVSDPSVYGMFVFTDLSMNYSYGSSSVSHDFGMWVQCPIDGTEKTDLPRSTAKFVVTGNPLDVKYTAFLKIKKDMSSLADYADIYDVTGEVTSIPTDPLYYGCSGVTFTVDAYDGSVMTLKGDSDPIGCVKLTFTAVKN